VGNFVNRAISWFRRPGVPDPEENMRTVLKAPYDPDTVDALLDKYEQRQKELLDWSDSLDRKLLAVITADGVYAALFSSVSVRSPVPILVVVLVGISVITSIVLAYTAWRPHPHATVPIDRFVNLMHIHPHDLQRILIVAHKSASCQVYGLNSWKAQKLTAAATCLAIGVLATICYAIIGGVL